MNVSQRFYVSWALYNHRRTMKQVCAWYSNHCLKYSKHRLQKHRKSFMLRIEKEELVISKIFSTENNILLTWVKWTIEPKNWIITSSIITFNLRRFLWTPCTNNRSQICLVSPRWSKNDGKGSSSRTKIVYPERKIVSPIYDSINSSMRNRSARNLKDAQKRLSSFVRNAFYY